MVETLILTKEQAGYLHDILQDYEAMIITAKNTIKEMRTQWEEVLKKSEGKDASDLAEKLETLKKDDSHVAIAEQRYEEIQQVVWTFLWIKKEDVKPDYTKPVDPSYVPGEEPLHTASESEEVVQSTPVA